MRIYLIGLPGSGKTTLGKQVAKALKLSFIDMDDAIEQSEGKSISDIFSKEGEAYFREIERAMLHQVAKEENCIISTGGGAACFFDNIDYMNKTGVTVFIDVSPEELTNRVSKGKNKRPLLDGVNSLLEEISAKHKQRMPFYAKAQLHIKGDSIQFGEILEGLKG